MPPRSSQNKRTPSSSTQGRSHHHNHNNASTASPTNSNSRYPQQSIHPQIHSHHNSNSNNPPPPPQQQQQYYPVQHQHQQQQQQQPMMMGHNINNGAPIFMSAPSGHAPILHHTAPIAPPSPMAATSSGSNSNSNKIGMGGVVTIPTGASPTNVYDMLADAHHGSSSGGVGLQRQLPPGWQRVDYQGSVVFIDHVSREAHEEAPWDVWRRRSDMASA